MNELPLIWGWWWDVKLWLYIERCAYLLVHPWTEEHGELQSTRFSGGTSGKEPAYQRRRPRRPLFPSLGREGPLEEGMTTHSSILAWSILWTEELGGLLFMESHRIGHNWVTKHNWELELYFISFESPQLATQWDLMSKWMGEWMSKRHLTYYIKDFFCI